MRCRVRLREPADDRGPDRSSQQLEQRCICARCCGLLHVHVARLGRLPIGDLDQDVGVFEHLVPRAAKEAVLAWSLSRDDALEQTAELGPPARCGLQFDDHFDGHVVLSGPPSYSDGDARPHPLLAAERPCDSRS